MEQHSVPEKGREPSTAACFNGFVSRDKWIYPTEFLFFIMYIQLEKSNYCEMNFFTWRIRIRRRWRWRKELSLSADIWLSKLCSEFSYCSIYVAYFKGEGGCTNWCHEIRRCVFSNLIFHCTKKRNMPILSRMAAIRNAYPTQIRIMALLTNSFVIFLKPLLANNGVMLQTRSLPLTFTLIHYARTIQIFDDVYLQLLAVSSSKFHHHHHHHHSTNNNSVFGASVFLL